MCVEIPSFLIWPDGTRYEESSSLSGLLKTDKRRRLSRSSCSDETRCYPLGDGSDSCGPPSCLSSPPPGQLLCQVESEIFTDQLSMKQTVGNLPSCTSIVTQTYVSDTVCEGTGVYFDPDSDYVNIGLASNTIVDETDDMLLFPISSKEFEGVDGMKLDLGDGEELKDIEVLRVSPKRRRKRKQSPSPPRTDRSLNTPHTPRKDTPKKIKNNIVCRHDGCEVIFGTIRSRDLHERSYCPNRGASNQTPFETSYEVPSHETLGLNTLQCRFPGCNKSYKTVVTRIRHERDSHRFIENRERTLSPHQFPSFSVQPPEHVSVNNTSFRPQSCPPSIVVETPTSDSSFLPPNFQSTPNPSPSLKSPFVPETSLPSRRLFSSGVLNQCQFCHYKFQQKTYLTRHKCSFNPNLTTSIIKPPLLTRPQGWEDTL